MADQFAQLQSDADALKASLAQLQSVTTAALADIAAKIAALQGQVAPPIALQLLEIEQATAALGQTVAQIGAADPGPIPTVTALSPTSGPAAGGTVVAITGTGFTKATNVIFGTTAAAGFTVAGDTAITATSPAGTGVVDVRVATPAGESPTSPADQFTYS